MTESINSPCSTLTGKNLALITALLPLSVFTVACSSLRSLIILAVSAASCVVFEAAVQKLLKQKIQVKDLSAVSAGLILALLLPESVELWQVVTGAFVAVVVAKVFFGGNGNYVFSPALIGRAFMYVSFKAGFADSKWLFPADDSQALAVVILVSLAFIYLVFLRVIQPEAPAAFTAAFFICASAAALVSGESVLPYASGKLISGAIIFLAVFVISDETTVPDSAAGRILYGALTAVLSFLIMIPGKTADGAMFAILIMNALAPYFSKKASKPAAGNGGAK